MYFHTPGYRVTPDELASLHRAKDVFMGEFSFVYLIRQKQFMSSGTKLFNEIQRRGFRQISLPFSVASADHFYRKDVLHVCASHKMKNYLKHPRTPLLPPPPSPAGYASNMSLTRDRKIETRKYVRLATPTNTSPRRYVLLFRCTIVD
jgi:hypothetical protein